MNAVSRWSFHRFVDYGRGDRDCSREGIRGLATFEWLADQHFLLQLDAHRAGYGDGMPRVVVDLDTDVPAERMMAAATDFSERRPELWPNISREFWQLHDQGPNWAEATEGSPGVWARERYEWSDNRVVGTTQDSNMWQPGGTWTLTVEPRGDARSHVRVVLDRRWKGKGWLFSVPVALFGRQMFTKNLQKTLDVLASSSR